MGGAAGPLYGTAFLRAAGAATGDLEADGVADVLEAGLGGIVARGRAEVGARRRAMPRHPRADVLCHVRRTRRRCGTP